LQLSHIYTPDSHIFLHVIGNKRINCFCCQRVYFGSVLSIKSSKLLSLLESSRDRGESGGKFSKSTGSSLLLLSSPIVYIGPSASSLELKLPSENGGGDAAATATRFEAFAIANRRARLDIGPSVSSLELQLPS